MGGYAMYVWPSILITLVVLIANVWLSKLQYKRVVHETKIRVNALAQKKASGSAAQTQHSDTSPS